MFEGVPQTFKDFTASSRYWRFHLLENHGASCTCFQELALHGADDRIIEFLNELEMSEYAEKIISKVHLFTTGCEKLYKSTKMITVGFYITINDQAKQDRIKINTDTYGIFIRYINMGKK